MNSSLKKKKEALSLGEKIEFDFKKSVRKELDKHKLAGNSISVLRDGKIIHLLPDQY